MKKLYIKPTVNTVLIEIQPMLAGSETPESVNPDETPQEYGSRQGRGFWDDEDKY